MLKRFIIIFLSGVCALVALTSCGENDLGGGIGEFTTVTATAVSQTNRLESDVLTGNVCSDTASTGGTFATDSINVNVTSKALFPAGSLDLLVSKITVKYIPVNPATTPPLPDFVINTSQTIQPGQTTQISVAVVPDAYKVALVSRSTQNLGLCSVDIFEYFVTIVFEMSEPGGNGKIKNVSANLNIAIADRTE